MLHPSDASLIGLYCKNTHTKVSDVCDGKNKTCRILFEPSRSQYTIPVIFKSHIKNRKFGFWLEDEANKV